MRGQSSTLLVRETALAGMLCAVAFALSYLEAMLPSPILVPGVKLGLANIAVMFAMYAVGVKVALCVAAAKVVLSAALFASPVGALCSLCGTTCAFLVLVVLHRSMPEQVVPASMCSAIAHNLGQLFVVICLVDVAALGAYAPVLVIAGCATGLVTGVILKQVLAALGPAARAFKGRGTCRGRN